MILQIKDNKIQKLAEEICNEHGSFAKSSDSNAAYLWYLQTKGTSSGLFKPFIFLAELNFLEYLKYITPEEKQNMIGMLKSKDHDNAFIMAYALLEFRKKRVAEKGLWSLKNEHYKEIIYSKDILNPSLFKPELIK